MCAIAAKEAASDWVVGLGGSSHDFSAALMHGGDIRVVIESERISRVKYGLPAFLRDPFEPAVRYCLDAEGIELADVARVVSSDLLPYRALDEWSVKTHPHHLCHAASAAVLVDPATTACILVYDGNGSARQVPGCEQGLGKLEVETFTAFRLADGSLERLGGTSGQRWLEWLGLNASCENSIGQMYELISEAIGFDTHEAGKTMGLAGWGEPRFLDLFMEHMRIGTDLGNVFGFDPFDRGFHQALEKILTDETDTFRSRADIAATAQEVFTRTVIAFYEMVADLEFDVVCLAGGCALNSVANGLLAEHLPPSRSLLVPPFAADTGIGLGALWLDAQEQGRGPRPLTMRGRPANPWLARPGREYAVRPGAGVGRELERVSVDLAIDSPRALAAELARGSVIGFFNGSSEIGPRALGGRSILADPRRIDLKERINRDIKRREPFRPLAPMVLESAFDRYFEPAVAANPFMLVVARGNETSRSRVPGILHVDGTARVQTVGPDGDPFLVELLEEFEQIAELPILLNTSFNGKGEPIVETPADAIFCFLSLGLDGLWLQNQFLRPVRESPGPD